ncbi:MAG: Swt1 family HEPN domain-containing protein [Blastocatellia bacterium]
MPDNHHRITEGFQLLTVTLAPYVCSQIKAQYGDEWWQKGVLDILFDNQRRDLPAKGDDETLMQSLDAARCLILIDQHWNGLFKAKLTRDHRNWIKELIGARNKWAHRGLVEPSDEDTWRALDTMTRMLEQLDAEATERIRELAREVRYGTTGASTTSVRTGNTGPLAKKTEPEVITTPTSDAAERKPGEAKIDAARTDKGGVITTVPRQGLQSWRFVAEPHPDVAQGRYRQAEFAADLSQVLRGTAQVEYQDPVEFFGRTYITEGMSGLLVQALRRVSSLKGGGGEPVIQLKTAFGGGKTHSMLALYHLLRGVAPLDKMPNAAEVTERAGVKDIPRTKVAILVGTALNPTKVRKPPTFPGISIRTLWGEMAAQLAEQAGNPKLFDIVRDADKSSVPPGSETLVELFDACGPCLILVDELIAYARKIYGVPGLVAGSFEAVLTFVQELTEAARASRNSLVVAAIPESDTEIGGEAGQRALEKIEHTFGRMESIWKPVGAEEGFEIVRRRLFLPVEDGSSRDDVCRAFNELYRQHGNEFPAECKEGVYLERMKNCYPIHPEVFDRLYNDWATIEGFQKTRGVLRLMAAVIHDLWVRQDASLLILPGSVPLDAMIVREELTRHLPEGWNTVIETDIDGQRSLPYRIDSDHPRLGQVMASRRVARSIFLGSAPSVKEQRVRGIEDLRVRLGVVQPGEQISVFNDALGRMVDHLVHLYGSNQRYWYDLPPNLRRTVDDRAQQIAPEDVELEIVSRLKKIRERADFKAVHTCVPSSDIPDELAARLVVLNPTEVHKAGNQESNAILAATEILNNRGNSPRNYRNMLAFVAPEKEIVPGLEQEARRYLAWKSVLDDAEALNLDAHQRKQAKENADRSDKTVDLRINEAYCWLLVPIQEGTGPVEWEATRISGGNDSYVVRAARRMKSSEQLITKWSPALLRMELDKWLWREQDYVSVKKLWEILGTYNYLPRLRDADVLLDAIREGLRSRDYFGYATSVSESGRFQGLQFGSSDGSIYLDSAGVLVKPEAAAQQLQTDQAAAQRPIDSTTIPTTTEVMSGVTTGDGSMTHQRTAVPAAARPNRFHGSVELDAARIGRDAGKIAEEVVQHLAGTLGAKVKVTLEIEVEIPEGVSDQILRTVTENCRTLKFRHAEFEKS